MPDPNPSDPSKFKKIMNANMDESILWRLPQDNGTEPATPVSQPVVTAVPPAAESAPSRRRLKLLPAFWTVASVMSITLNIALIVILIMLFQMLGTIQSTADDKISGLLGGLYNNFVKMDQATISKVITVDANIPLDIKVPVNLQTAEQITLASDAVIPNANVLISQGGININAPARVTLPEGTILYVYLQPFEIPVQTSIPVHLEVPVTIPLDQTQLHEPFVGLQEVVGPWYCLVEPDAVMDGVQVCSPTVSSPTPAPMETITP